MNKQNIQEYIKALNHMKEFFEELLNEGESTTFLSSQSNTNEENQKLKEFTNLRLLTKLKAWPEALPQDLICSESDDEKFYRANCIIDDFEIKSTKNLNFLDFGCGEGHIVFKQGELSKKSVGYDIECQNWSRFEIKDNVIFSNNWNEIEKNGPYDFILCSDVLDHASDPFDCLKKIQSVKTPQTGKIYIRIHPWTSRHGTHLYKQINKAYLHIIFSEDELFSMGFIPNKVNQILDSLNFYKNIFQEIGLTILKEDIIKQPIERFFLNNQHIKNRIAKHWSKEIVFKEIVNQLEIQFLDFTLI